MMTRTKPRRKTLCVRGFDADLYAAVKAQAKAEDMRVGEWLERTAIRELVRARKEQVRMEADLLDSASEGSQLDGPMPRKEPAKLSNGELKRIHASSLRLTKNIDRAQIREMIRRGFFSKGIWLDELDVLESVAKEIMNDREREGRTMLEIDPELWMKAKEIVDVAARVPPKERRPGAAATRKSRKSKPP